jgi:uncharacterized protein (DUF1697 family)
MPKKSRYVAFLRGINVGGNKLIKMDALAAAFTSAGFRNVKTYIASGNVIFDSAATKPEVLSKKIEQKLLQTFGHQIAVMVFPLSDLEALVKRNPFKRVKRDAEVMLFVTFLRSEVAPVKSLLESKTENLKVIAVENRAAFIVARRQQTGRVGFPNNFIEKEFGVAATTRNWSTVQKVVVAGLAVKNV